MKKEPGKNTYGKFEVMGMGMGTTVRAAPASGVHRAINPSTLRIDKSQNQVNKWIIFSLSASASFMTALDGSIVNIGLPSIGNTFHTGVGGAIERIVIGDR